MVSETFFTVFLNHKPMGAINPETVASLHPRGLIGRIYEGDN